MDLPVFIKSEISSLKLLCQKHKVASLYLFGSALTPQFNTQSDLDFLVTFGAVPPLDYADNFFDLRDALSQLFQRRIDLVEAQTLRNPYFKKVVEKTKVLIYAGGPGVQMAA